MKNVTEDKTKSKSAESSILFLIEAYEKSKDSKQNGLSFDEWLDIQLFKVADRSR
jgi:hypothetical protein